MDASSGLADAGREPCHEDDGLIGPRRGKTNVTVASHIPRQLEVTIPPPCPHLPTAAHATPGPAFETALRTLGVRLPRGREKLLLVLVCIRRASLSLSLSLRALRRMDLRPPGVEDKQAGVVAGGNISSSSQRIYYHTPLSGYSVSPNNGASDIPHDVTVQSSRGAARHHSGTSYGKHPTALAPVFVPATCLPPVSRYVARPPLSPVCETVFSLRPGGWLGASLRWRGDDDGIFFDSRMFIPSTHGTDDIPDGPAAALPCPACARAHSAPYRFDFHPDHLSVVASRGL